MLFDISLQEALAPRAARNTKSYAEINNQMEKTMKKKKRGVEAQERPPRRHTSRNTEFSAHTPAAIEGSSARVREWSFGNLSKKDAANFVRAVSSLTWWSRIFVIVIVLMEAASSVFRYTVPCKPNLDKLVVVLLSFEAVL